LGVESSSVNLRLLTCDSPGDSSNQQCHFYRTTSDTFYWQYVCICSGLVVPCITCLTTHPVMLRRRHRCKVTTIMY